MIVLNDNRMIFPFLTEKLPLDYLANVCKVNRKGNDVHPWVLANLTPREIRKELRELNLPENPNRVLLSYRLDKNCYGIYGLNYDSIFIVPHNNLADIEFSLLDIVVHSFSTGVSFLELRYSVKSQNEVDALNMNYFLSELKADVMLKIVRSTWNEELKKKEESSELITTSKFLRELLNDYEKVYDMDMNEEFKSYSNKPILFSYFLLDSAGRELAKNLGLNMKETYKVSVNSIRQTQAFDNSAWYYSLNSVVNVSNVSDDEGTSDFFRTTFVDKISNLYFFLFLHALHQRFFLQLSQYKIKSFNYEAASFNEIKGLVDELSGYSSCINKAWLKFFFARPASIDHVNLFYANVRETFDITNQMESVQSELERLTDYTDRKYKLFDEHSKLLSSKRKSRFDLIYFFVAAIIYFVSIYDTFIKMIKNFGVELTIPVHIVLAVLFMVICFIVPTVINFYFNIKKMKKISKEIIHIENLICEDKQEQYF